MLSFRKMLWALALMAACVTIASAQVTPFQCAANVGVPPIARNEGLAEEVGQVVIICTGGSPTPVGQLIPTVNIQVFLNTNITSKIMADPWTEALLLIDEPTPGNGQLVCGAAGTNFDSVTGTCKVTAATSIGVGPRNNPWSLPGTYDGQTGHPNIWQARCTQSTCASSAPNSIVWLGVPVDPPGTSGQRVLRMTNIRANAAGGSLVSGTLLPSAIYMVISISGTGSLPVTQQSLTVAIVLKGMEFSVQGGSSFNQCEPRTGLCPAFRLRYQELFGTAFRKQHSTASLQTITTGILASVDQNVPGSIYNSEGMFYGTNLADLTGLSPSRGNLGHSTSGAGRATQGTRLIARFSNVPLNVTLYVTAQNTNPYTSSSSGNNAAVTLTNADGSGAFTLPSFSSSLITPTTCSTGSNKIDGLNGAQLYQVPLVSSGTVNSGMVVWEVLEADTGVIDRMEFGVTVQYSASPLPSLGAATVTGNYAPLSTVNTMSATAPVPRFIDNPQSSTTFSINPCRTNLLFPFITNQVGFDTGLAVGNTSASPFESRAPRQTGKCEYNFYGSFTADPTRTVFVQTTTSNVEPGTQALMTLSGGGTHGLAAVAGFQGYLIVRCEFQFAHGFAFISPAGAANISSMGYVALVMDANPSSFPRTNTVSESLGQ